MMPLPRLRDYPKPVLVPIQRAGNEKLHEAEGKVIAALSWAAGELSRTQRIPPDGLELVAMPLEVLRLLGHLDQRIATTAAIAYLEERIIELARHGMLEDLTFVSESFKPAFQRASEILKARTGCPACHGSGVVAHLSPPGLENTLMPCPSCGGRS